MWSYAVRSRALPFVALLALAAPASAEGFRVVGVGGSGDDGYAGEFVRGTYVGAPLTRFPRPTQIVPAPWSYGTYGIPTVAGIAAAPVAQPTLTVINGRASDGQVRRGGPSGERIRPASAQVIEVQVPRR